ncbi:hypothetical protein K9M79_03395 [Candidatus Woesearchaeota archaeon]|nr:hypothetical protein [Candidatus Woesearchaeota archaeon]
MKVLIVTVSQNPAEVAHVKRLLSEGEWKKVIMIGFDKTKEIVHTFECLNNDLFNYILCDPTMPIPEISSTLGSELSEASGEYEVAVNFTSGTGKLHMAVLSAVLKLGVGVRLVTISEKGVIQI